MKIEKLEHFPTNSNRISGPENALALCFDEHLYPMGDPIRSDDALAIPQVLPITPPRYGDARGYFSETYSLSRAIQARLTAPFVQDNQSFSRAKGTLRGLHCQLAPYAQGKLVHGLRGATWDMAVDARTGSPTFGQHAAAVLSADNGSQHWIPPGATAWAPPSPPSERAKARPNSH